MLFRRHPRRSKFCLGEYLPVIIVSITSVGSTVGTTV